MDNRRAMASSSANHAGEDLVEADAIIGSPVGATSMIPEPQCWHPFMQGVSACRGGVSELGFSLEAYQCVGLRACFVGSVLCNGFLDCSGPDARLSDLPSRKTHR